MAVWFAGGAITVGLGEVAHVLGRTGERIFSAGGGVQYLGWLLILAGAWPVCRRFVAKRFNRSPQ